MASSSSETASTALTVAGNLSAPGVGVGGIGRMGLLPAPMVANPNNLHLPPDIVCVQLSSNEKPTDPQKPDYSDFISVRLVGNGSTRGSLGIGIQLPVLQTGPFRVRPQGTQDNPNPDYRPKSMAQAVRKYTFRAAPGHEHDFKQMVGFLDDLLAAAAAFVVQNPQVYPGMVKTLKTKLNNAEADEKAMIDYLVQSSQPMHPVKRSDDGYEPHLDLSWNMFSFAPITATILKKLKAGELTSEDGQHVYRIMPMSSEYEDYHGYLSMAQDNPTMDLKYAPRMPNDLRFYTTSGELQPVDWIPPLHTIMTGQAAMRVKTVNIPGGQFGVKIAFVLAGGIVISEGKPLAKLTADADVETWMAHINKETKYDQKWAHIVRKTIDNLATVGSKRSIEASSSNGGESGPSKRTRLALTQGGEEIDPDEEEEEEEEQQEEEEDEEEESDIASVD